MVFADGAVLASLTHDGLQRLMDRFSKACKGFALTISIKKTEVMAQDPPIPPSITIDDLQLAVVDNFRYLGSNISQTLSLDVEINVRIGKAAGVMSKLTKRVWENKNLTLSTKLKIYHALFYTVVKHGQLTQDRRLN
ncbi:uncharacterized protein LOC144359137 [Saccoglossus kowalevskii]